MSNSTKSRFGNNAALDELASRLHRSMSEIVRQAILREVASGGTVSRVIA